MKDITQKLYDSLAGLVDSVIAAAPNILMGLVLIVVALIVAKIIEKVLRMILVRVKFDELVQRTGIDTVVIAMTRTPRDELYSSLTAAGAAVHRVGDVVAPRRIEAIIYDAEKLARAI